MSDEPWVPAEVVKTTNGDEIGYVIDDGEWLTILTARDRTLTRLRSTTVTRRTLCSTEPHSGARTLPDILTGARSSGTYPMCP